MDENFNNNTENSQHNVEDIGNDRKSTTVDENGIKNLSMDDSGHIHTDKNGAATMMLSSRMFLILGWISAALTAFISPYFAIAGISFGALANKQDRGSGNAVITTNIVLAIINLLFGLFLIVALRRMMLGY